MSYNDIHTCVDYIDYGIALVITKSTLLMINEEDHIMIIGHLLMYIKVVLH